MSVVAFVRGLNVGGHRRCRPSLIAAELATRATSWLSNMTTSCLSLFRPRLIGLGQLDSILGSPVTIRNWNTIANLMRVLKQ